MLTREYIEAEIANLETEKQKAHGFMLQADGAIAAWKTALSKLDEAGQDQGDMECGPTS